MPPLKKGAYCFATVGMSVGRSVCRLSVVRSKSFDPFIWSIPNLMQGLPSMSRWSLLIFRSHVQRSRSNHPLMFWNISCFFFFFQAFSWLLDDVSRKYTWNNKIHMHGKRFCPKGYLVFSLFHNNYQLGNLVETGQEKLVKMLWMLQMYLKKVKNVKSLCLTRQTILVNFWFIQYESIFGEQKIDTIRWTC